MKKLLLYGRKWVVLPRNLGHSITVQYTVRYTETILAAYDYFTVRISVPDITVVIRSVNEPYGLTWVWVEARRGERRRLGK